MCVKKLEITWLCGKIEKQVVHHRQDGVAFGTSSATKAENLENDFTDAIENKVVELGLGRCWLEQEDGHGS